MRPEDMTPSEPGTDPVPSRSQSKRRDPRSHVGGSAEEHHDDEHENREHDTTGEQRPGRNVVDDAHGRRGLHRARSNSVRRPDEDATAGRDRGLGSRTPRTHLLLRDRTRSIDGAEATTLTYNRLSRRT